MKKEAIVILACSKKKLFKPINRIMVSAKNLYQGPVFRKGRILAEETNSGYFILSAQHGIVSPNEKLKSYNCCLGAKNKYCEISVDRFLNKSQKRKKQVLNWRSDFNKKKILLIGGNTYYTQALKEILQNNFYYLSMSFFKTNFIKQFLRKSLKKKKINFKNNKIKLCEIKHGAKK